jgi:hypothetical protein
MQRDLIGGIVLLSMLFAPVLWAGNDDEHKFDTKFSGYTYIEAGEVMKGYGYQGVYDHRWLSDLCIGIFANTPIDEHLKVLMGFEGQLTTSFNTWPEKNLPYMPLRYPINSFWVSQGEGFYTFGDPGKISLEIEAGYFPYKYNNEVRNLGEYLFRTYCYPPTMFNLFDRTFTELMGVRIGNTFGGIFHHDLILNSETKQYPFYDGTISYLADAKNPEFLFAKSGFITLGGGIQLYRFIPVRGDLTNKHAQNDANLISRDSVGWYFDSATQTRTTIYKEKWVGFPGTKVMGRATVNIKSALPDFITNFMGKEDLKLYGEVAVLGWDNDTVFYTKRYQRTPFTVGFNLPTFKFLDILNTEIEYLNTPYWNSSFRPMVECLPLYDTKSDISDVHHEKLKWSVYAKKTIGTRMIISAQVANDHLMPKSGVVDESIQDYHDVTLRHGDWWWNFRARFDF